MNKLNVLFFLLLTSAVMGAGKAPVTVLLDAIEQVESGGQSDKIGDNGNAVGSYQIWPIMVKDVNLILGKDKYTLQDRLSRVKSREMCVIYLNHYCKGKSNEYMARCWNGGPMGYKKEATKTYWNRIRKEMGK